MTRNLGITGLRTGNLCGATCVCATLLPLWLIGCHDAGGGASNPLAVNPRPFIVDVPFPEGFKYIPGRSSDNFSGGVRYVKHEYEGQANPAAVRNFFREQMPTKQWKKLSDQNTKGDITLTYEKEGETCTLEILPRNFLGFPKTVVRVTISKIDRGAAAPAS